MISKKALLSACVLTLSATTLSGAVLSAEKPEKFDPAAAMERLKKLREQSLVVRGNVDESIRRNREAEAEAQRKMKEAENKIRGRMGEMSAEGAKLIQDLEVYRQQFMLDVQKATDIDAHLLESMRKFRGVLERAKALGEKYYQERKAEVKAILDEYLNVYKEFHIEMEAEVKNHLREMGIED